jgi:hypothetical protein
MIRSLLINVFIFIAGSSAYSADIPRVPVPETVLNFLAKLPANTNRLAQETNDYSGKALAWRSQDRWSYEEALSFLRKSTLPDITRCARIKTRAVLPPRTYYATTNQWLGLWTITNAQGQEVFMGADLLPLTADELPEIHPVSSSFEDELKIFADIFLRRVPVTNAGWNLSLSSIAQRKYWTDSSSAVPAVIVHHGLCGLLLGMTNTTGPLFDSISFRLAFTNSLAAFMRVRALDTWQIGLTNLLRGRALVDVLLPWEEHAHAFGTNVIPEIPEYVSSLDGQLNEFARLRDSTVEDPPGLAPMDRARYYVERLSQSKREDHGIGFFKAGTPAPELVAMGRDALPILIEGFGDRRLTRLRGDEKTKVLLVQDLAIECFEQIAGATLRTNYETYGHFSILPFAKRQEITSMARDWLARYGNKHEAVGQLAIAEWRPMVRLSVLQDVEFRYPGVVNGLDYLKRWASEGNSNELRQLAWQLALYGDRSLLPRVRKSVIEGEVLNGDYLSGFGDPEDFKLLQNAIRPRLFATNLLHAHVLLAPIVDIAAGTKTNNFTPASCALPVLMDAMECRRVTPASSSKTKTLADVAFPGLLKLTEYKIGYSTNAPVRERMAAMDVWLGWWEAEGRDAFSRRHPEVISLFGRLEPENGLDAPRSSTKTVLVLSCEPPTEYRMEAAEAVTLAKTGKLRLRLLGDNAIGRFLDPEAERAWFTSPVNSGLREPLQRQPGPPP